MYMIRLHLCTTKLLYLPRVEVVRQQRMEPVPLKGNWPRGVAHVQKCHNKRGAVIDHFDTSAAENNDGDVDRRGKLLQQHIEGPLARVAESHRVSLAVQGLDDVGQLGGRLDTVVQQGVDGLGHVVDDDGVAVVLAVAVGGGGDKAKWPGVSQLAGGAAVAVEQTGLAADARDLLLRCCCCVAGSLEGLFGGSDGGDGCLLLLVGVDQLLAVVLVLLLPGQQLQLEQTSGGRVGAGTGGVEALLGLDDTVLGLLGRGVGSDEGSDSHVGALQSRLDVARNALKGCDIFGTVCLNDLLLFVFAANVCVRVVKNTHKGVLDAEDRK